MPALVEDPFAAITQPPDPTVVAGVAQLEAVVAANRPGTVTVEEMRAQERAQAALNPGAAQREDAVERSLDTPLGAVRLRVLSTAARPSAVYVHIHGGGWVGGGHDVRDAFLDDLRTRLDATVVSVAYRLAPEHPFPAAQDDCEAALTWILDHAEAEFGTSTVVLGGESAGAHLSAVTLLRLRDRRGKTGIAAADLRYGCFDLRMTPSVRHWPRPTLDRRTFEWLLPQVVGEMSPDDPDVSPFLGDLRDLPPAIFTVGTGDSLLDDSILMWARWRAAGNDAELAITPAAPHGFDLMPFPVSEPARERAAQFVRTCIAARGATVS